LSLSNISNPLGLAGLWTIFTLEIPYACIQHLLLIENACGEGSLYSIIRVSAINFPQNLHRHAQICLYRKSYVVWTVNTTFCLEYLYVMMYAFDWNLLVQQSISLQQQIPIKCKEQTKFSKRRMNVQPT
jgi:hypothetical protein